MQRKIRFDKGRIFLFIDETGDPGHPSKRDASRYYQLNIVVSHRNSLKHLYKHLAAFRYFKDFGKELKKQVGQEKIIARFFEDIAMKNGVVFLSFMVEKEGYIDSYLESIGKMVSDYDSNMFRSFIVKISLEYLFNTLLEIDLKHNNFEIVFDRYLESEVDEEDLKKYLRGNYKLPTFEKIVQVDSEYCEPLQVSDFIGRLVKHHYVDKKNEDQDLISFIQVFSIKNPATVEAKKRPGHR